MNSVKLQDTKSILKNLLFLYTNNKLSEWEIKKIIPFTIASKIIKYLGINLTKEVKYLSVKTVRQWKKLKKAQINGNIFHAHGLEELILLKCPYHTKHSTDSM